jgi:IS5 family transposase
MGRAAATVAPASASTTDPEARWMKLADGGLAPAYNLQLATDTASGMIVGVELVNSATDHGQAQPVIEQVAARTGQLPGACLMDRGYISLEQIGHLEQRGVAVYAPPLRDRGGNPTAPRATDTPGVLAWRERMLSPEADGVYRERAASAEWTNAQVHGRYGLDRLPVRGLLRGTSAVLLIAIAHNLLRWISLGTPLSS